MINHDLFNTYGKWFELPVEPVYIHCLHPLRNMYHAACVEARSSGTDMIKVFQFSLTKQQFGAYAYEPGIWILGFNRLQEVLQEVLHQTCIVHKLSEISGPCTRLYP